MPREKSLVFLIGFMAAGKSTVGRRLGERTGLPVAETDALIRDAAGKSIPEIFEEEGEESFRQRESACLFSLGRGPRIVSCGGGIILREQNVRWMKENGVVVRLTAEPETVLARLAAAGEERPLLRGRRTAEGIREMQARREAAYAGAADITVATDGRTPDEIAGKILEYLYCGEHPYCIII